MQREEFLKCEYQSLRDEITETKARIFRLAGFGLVGMPAAYYLAQTYQIEVLVLSLPVLICTLVLLYFAESRALMRCGSYIRNNIEPLVFGREKNRGGWESWLAQNPHGEADRRIVDKLVAFFFYLLFLYYYVASVHLASTNARELFGAVGFAVTLAVYVGIGIVFLAFMITNFRFLTQTSGRAKISEQSQ